MTTFDEVLVKASSDFMVKPSRLGWGGKKIK